MKIDKLIKLLKEAKDDWFENVYRANQERDKWWDFELEYAENEEWENTDVILTISN